MRSAFLITLWASALAMTAATAAPRPKLSAETLKYVAVDVPVLAIVHGKLVDGTGGPAREDQTVVVEDGLIQAVGPSASVAVPVGARVIDATGKTIIPGLVHMHEHLYYPMEPGKAYGFQANSFSRLYLAGGVTSMRTAGAINFAGDLHVRDAINAGLLPGPWIDVTSPYITGRPLAVSQFMAVDTARQASDAVALYARQGATSFKVYTDITRAQLAAVVRKAHALGLKVTDHLCSVTLREAADLGIDNIEHGFIWATDFKTGKKPDVCSGPPTEAELAADPAKAEALLDHLVAKHVAYTSTLSVRDTARARPGLEILAPDVQALFRSAEGLKPADAPPSSRQVLLNRFAKRFYDKGGLLLVGSDPTGGGGVVPGFANQHEIELLVEGGFTFEQAIKASTLNGALYLGRDKLIGTIAAGKQAELVLIGGDPSRNVHDIRKVEIVFKQGVGYDPKALIDSVRGKAGLY